MCFTVSQLGSIQYIVSPTIILTCDNSNLATTYSLHHSQENRTIIITCTSHRGKTRDIFICCLYFHTCNRFSSNITISGANAILAQNINLIMNEEILNNTTLLLPLGHISFSLPLALESIIQSIFKHLTPMAFRCCSYALHVVNFINKSDMFRSVCICISLRFHASLILE